jgi:hypothetical protein
MAWLRALTGYSINNEVLPVVGPDPANAARIAISSSSVQSSALTGGVYYIANSQACYVNIGTNPTAANAAAALPLFGPSLLPILIGEQEKIAVIRDTTDGYLWIIPVKTS